MLGEEDAFAGLDWAIGYDSGARGGAKGPGRSAAARILGFGTDRPDVWVDKRHTKGDSLMMSRCLWDPEKNRRLITERGVSFEEVAALIESGAIVEVFEHPDPGRAHQRIAVIEIAQYAYLVPYVETEEGDFFLKTIIPSRKATRKYLAKDEER